MDKLGLSWKRVCAGFLLCTATAVASPAQTFRVLHNFDYTQGAYPFAGLVQGTDGSLYGATVQGGVDTYGTVYKMSRTGVLTLLHSFDGTDGDEPWATPIQGSDGNYYGTAAQGGSDFEGTIYKMTPSGSATALYSFCSQANCTDGAGPQANLVQAIDGNLYGTTGGGGAFGGGTVFRITPGGTLTTLYSFCSMSNCADGEYPYAGLVQGADGNLYGTTVYGGLASGSNGYGTLFKITLTGALSTIHTFGGPEGEYPGADLVLATDGTIYGTAEAGGTSGSCLGGCGTLFALSPSGVLTTLHDFQSTDGAIPTGLLLGTDGNLYGTTELGGVPGASCGTGVGCGTIFRATTGGTLTTLYNFCSRSRCADGTSPFAALIEDTDGLLYGTTLYGGTSTACHSDGCGTIFSLSVGLEAFVETEPSFGKIGKAIYILGTNLTGATSVTFNGTPATFTVEASSVIKATVPAGATTGTVQVVTPSGTLSSNVPFTVAP
jgi:uncharacterized repeat protein (TIGR03803 family)